MANIIDERGYNQIFKATHTRAICLRQRAETIVLGMALPATLQTRSRMNILSLGCGTGELTYHLAVLTGAQVTGVDLSQQFIDYAKTTHNHERLTFLVADLSRPIPYSDAEKYDSSGNGILHHLYHHLHTFLPAVGRWLAPGSRLIFLGI